MLQKISQISIFQIKLKIKKLISDILFSSWNKPLMQYFYCQTLKNI